MMESICTIPLTEILEPRDGCPLCKMRDMLERRVIDYITGPAMMEPEVRIKSNELGFCHTHLEQMLAGRNRLPVALTLETHLAELQKRVFGEGKPALMQPSAKKRRYETCRVQETCLVCDRMEWGMSRMVENLLSMIDSEPEMRRLFEEQPALCLPHYSLLLSKAEQGIGKRYRTEFVQTLHRLAGGYLDSLHADVRHFCDMFDYRNNGENADWGNARDSLERAAWWLTSRETNR